jgi:hypothetical protein
MPGTSGERAFGAPTMGSENAQPFAGTGNQVFFATQSVSSTVDEPQSASKAIYHSLPSESRGGPGPTWLSEGGWAGGGGIRANLRRTTRSMCAFLGGTGERSGFVAFVDAWRF